MRGFNSLALTQEHADCARGQAVFSRCTLDGVEIHALGVQMTCAIGQYVQIIEDIDEVDMAERNAYLMTFSNILQFWENLYTQFVMLDPANNEVYEKAYRFVMAQMPVVRVVYDAKDS